MTAQAAQSLREPDQTSTTSDLDFSEYTRIAHRQRWTILLTTLIFTLLAHIFTLVGPSNYSASTTVLLQPGLTDLTSTVTQTVDVQTQAEYAASTVVASQVQQQVPGDQSVDELLNNLAVSLGSGESTTLIFTYTDPDATTARTVSLAFAEEYLSQRQETLKASVKLAQQRARERVQQRERQLASLQADSAKPPQQSSTLETLLANEIQDLRASLNRFSLVTVDPGLVIGVPAPADELKASPSQVTTVTAGLLLGLFAGLILAFARDRSSKRIAWSPSSPAAISPEVVEVIPGARRAMQQFSQTGMVSPTGNTGAALARASEYVRSRLASGHALILVTSPESDDYTSMIATGLADNLASTGTPVTLITRATSRAGLGDESVRSSATFKEVLDREVDLSAVGAMSHRSAPMRVIRFGEVEPGALRTPAAQDAIRRLKESTTALIVDAPPLMGGADALALSTEADFVLIVLADGVTRRDSLTTAADHVAGVTHGRMASIVVTK
jgi:capsular polysaccharide biosynthesis protein